MINTDRIVPIEKIDLISMYGLILKVTNEGSIDALQANDIDGNFTVNDAEYDYILNQPVKSVNFGESVTEGILYFVPAYDYAGFSINGVAAEAAEGSVEVDADGHSLYKAVLASGDITITKVGF